MEHSVDRTIETETNRGDSRNSKHFFPAVTAVGRRIYGCIGARGREGGGRWVDGTGPRRGRSGGGEVAKGERFHDFEKKIHFAIEPSRNRYGT